MTDLPTPARAASERFVVPRLSLAAQFVLAGGAVLVAGMIAIGVWVTRQIEEGVTSNTAITTALYVDSVIAPLLEDIQDDGKLGEGARRALDETVARSFGSRIVSFKIWARDGTIAYSSQAELIGQRFDPTDSLKAAWAGRVAAEFDDLGDGEDALERARALPLLEIYSPVREPWSGKVVAVMEFYEVATGLKDDIAATRQRSWLVVAGVTIGMMGLLFGIVLRGSRMIDSQRGALEARVAELSALLAQNEELRRKVQGASSRAVTLNERHLKRVSADLHDGPAQLLALASLRLGDPDLPAAEIERIRGHLDDAMTEIRAICRGLALPQIERMALTALVDEAVAAHAARTSTSVEVVVEPEAAGLALTTPEKICVYRFVQEGLANAFKHAGGLGQSVTVRRDGGQLVVSVADRGPGLPADPASGGGLGLLGLRERVESLGGGFEIADAAPGVRLAMRITVGARRPEGNGTGRGDGG